MQEVTYNFIAINFTTNYVGAFTLLTKALVNFVTVNTCSVMTYEEDKYILCNIGDSITVKGLYTELSLSDRVKIEFITNSLIGLMSEGACVVVSNGGSNYVMCRVDGFIKVRKMV